MLQAAPIRIAAVSFACVLAASCTAQADSPKTPAKAPPAKSSPMPEERAKSLLEKQMKALPADNAALLATFAKDAVVMLPRVAAKIEPDLELGGQIAGMNPHAEMKGAQLSQLVAGGASSMAWLAADLEITVVSAEPGEKPSSATHTVRAVELLDAASDWKVVAASFTEVRSLEQLRESLGPIPSPTPPGPLVKLLAVPDELAASLSADPVVVFGTDKAERAVGRAAAKALLAKWRKLPLAIEEADKVREVCAASWGFAMADVNIPKPGGAPFRMSAFLVAVPGPSGSWSVVAVNYGAR
ncbi:MAG TPA: hypothetical protein VMS11_11305 [Solirubrobacterales bacterium]|nr:hypothetical protein [Solirubrobacterales bacterium]